MKKSIVLFVMFALVLSNNLFANNFPSDTLARNSRVSKVSKEITRQPEAALSAAEIAFQEEIIAYYNKKYSNPLKIAQPKLEKVIVVDAEGKVVFEEMLADHKVHEAHLPVGAAKLMVHGNTAYYVVHE
jgi:hypothetical protein